MNPSSRIRTYQWSQWTTLSVYVSTVTQGEGEGRRYTDGRVWGGVNWSSSRSGKVFKPLSGYFYHRCVFVPKSIRKDGWKRYQRVERGPVNEGSRKVLIYHWLRVTYRELVRLSQVGVQVHKFDFFWLTTKKSTIPRCGRWPDWLRRSTVFICKTF